MFIKRFAGIGSVIGLLYIIQHAQYVTAYNKFGLLVPPVPTPVAIYIGIIFILAGVTAMSKYRKFSSFLYFCAFLAAATHAVFAFSGWLAIYSHACWALYAYSGMLFLASIFGFLAGIQVRRAKRE